MWVKKSVGIILLTEDYSKVLLVQKRVSYAFAEFVRGKYDNIRIPSLFNNMTLPEKLILKSNDFNLIWYYLNLTQEKTDFYFKCLLKFNNFINDGGKQLKNYINNSQNNNDLLWEPPKGRKGVDEGNCECAMRELEEETGIDSSKYKFFVYIKNNKYISTNIGHKTKYIAIYYTAKSKNEEIPKFNNNNDEQIIEIIDSKWIPVDKLHGYHMDNELKQYIISLATRLKKTKRNIITYN